MGDSKKVKALLSGIRVLDLADEKAGFCPKILADLGAQVIKVERPGGDPSRKSGPFLDSPRLSQKSLSFFYNNTNKLGITLDIRQKQGKAIFLRLAQGVDVVVETFPPGYLENIGLSFGTLQNVNPGLILVSVTAFGQNGPKSTYKSCDLVASAFGGQMYVSGSPSTPPLKTFGEQSYFSASLFAAIGILLALQKRNQKGAGTHLDISLQESVAASLEHVFVRYFCDRVIPERQGSRHWNDAFFIFPCRDGFIHMTVFQQWETLIEWLDSEGMADDLKDPNWEDGQFRAEHADHVIEVLGRWTKTHTVKELFELGQLMRFPWAPIQSPMEVANCPQLKAREFFVSPEHSDDDAALMYPRIPYRFGPAITVPQKPAPEPGEDNREIYQKELGISDEELRRLHSMGVI